LNWTALTVTIIVGVFAIVQRFSALDQCKIMSVCTSVQTDDAMSSTHGRLMGETSPGSRDDEPTAEAYNTDATDIGALLQGSTLPNCTVSRKMHQL